jgi:hypothetical protein
MSTTRTYAVGILLASGRVLLAGGSKTGGGLPLSSTEVYDPATDRWRDGEDMTVARMNATGALLSSGQVLVMGGLTEPYGALSSAELGTRG